MKEPRNSTAERYSRRDFPAYRHRPGQTPHPIRDPAGHSFGKETPPVALEEEHWATNDGYRFAIDLFNRGYYWEAHEELEALWIGSGRNSAVGVFLQGLIQAAAALLKRDCGNQTAALRLAVSAGQKLRLSRALSLGFNPEALAQALDQKLTEHLEIILGTGTINSGEEE